MTNVLNGKAYINSEAGIYSSVSMWAVDFVRFCVWSDSATSIASVSGSGASSGDLDESCESCAMASFILIVAAYVFARSSAYSHLATSASAKSSVACSIEGDSICARAYVCVVLCSV